jgi:ferredoxin
LQRPKCQLCQQCQRVCIVKLAPVSPVVAERRYQNATERWRRAWRSSGAVADHTQRDVAPPRERAHSACQRTVRAHMLWRCSSSARQRPRRYAPSFTRVVSSRLLSSCADCFQALRALSRRENTHGQSLAGRRCPGGYALRDCAPPRLADGHPRLATHLWIARRSAQLFGPL